MATARLKATSGGWTHRTVATATGRRRSSGDVDQGLQAFLNTLAATGNVDLLESGEAVVKHASLFLSGRGAQIVTNL